MSRFVERCGSPVGSVCGWPNLRTTSRGETHVHTWGALEQGIKSLGSHFRQPGFKSQLGHKLAVRYGINYLASLSLGELRHKWGNDNHLGFYWDWMMLGHKALSTTNKLYDNNRISATANWVGIFISAGHSVLAKGQSWWHIDNSYSSGCPSCLQFNSPILFVPKEVLHM